MSRQFNLRVALWLLVVLIFVSSLTAMAAGNTVPSSRLDEQTSTINANALKPVSCAALNLTRVVVCTGAATCNGTNSRELILGTSNAETIQGRGGTDCILGGGGDDNIVGNGASDVCIGGPGTDTFTTCETTIQ